jgi:pyridoxal phosphate enzyme (YggS family)
MNRDQILHSIEYLQRSIPPEVTIVAAAKGRSPEEIQIAIQGGIQNIGQNYVQEAQAVIDVVEGSVSWHMIGHLQRNKAAKAVELFDMIETVDTLRLAQAINRRCEPLNKVMPILVEVNSGRESSKAGVHPEHLEALVEAISELPFLHLQGLMTMGPAFGDPDNARPFFRETRKAFNYLMKKNLPNVEMRMLSMGMSNSYKVAIEEGANIIRLGTILFGPRNN